MNFEEVEIILEEIYGNAGIVYHRGNENKLSRLLEKNYVNYNKVDFDNWDKALYTTYDLKSQIKNSSQNMKAVYGKYIIKLYVKGIRNFWFCDYKTYSLYNSCTLENWKQQQFNKFKIPKEFQSVLMGSDKNETAHHSVISRFFEKQKYLATRVKGIEYNSSADGHCLLIYDWSTAVPISYSEDEGKSWKKIEKNKTLFQKNKLKNNDYIEFYKEKVVSQNSKPKIEAVVKQNGDCDFSRKAIKTLSGKNLPEIINGNFNCSYNLLTNLDGAPKKIKKDFICHGNKSLKKANIIKYLQVADIGGKIITDFGEFDSKAEALKNFPY